MPLIFCTLTTNTEATFITYDQSVVFMPKINYHVDVTLSFRRCHSLLHPKHRFLLKGSGALRAHAHTHDSGGPKHEDVKQKVPVVSSDGSSDENQTSVVRRENKGAKVNPMIQKVT